MSKKNDVKNNNEEAAPLLETNVDGQAKVVNDVAEGNTSAKMGLFGGIAMITGNIVGSGIFITVGDTMKVAPPSVGIVLVFWIIGGLVALCGGFAYVELGKRFPKSGGELNYLSAGLGKPFGATFTYIYLFLVKTIILAAVSLTFGKYGVELFVPGLRGAEMAEKFLALFVIAVVFFVNIFGPQLAQKTQEFFLVLKLLALSVIIIAGIVHMCMNGSPEMKHMFSFNEINYGELGSCFISVLFCYEGWNMLSGVVGDMRNPNRDLLPSIIFGVIIVIVLYCLTMVSYVAVLGYNAVTYVDTVASLFAQKIFAKFSFIIPIFICISTFGTCNGTMYSVPQIPLAAALEGSTSRTFALVHKKSGVPILSMVLLTLVSAVFVFTSFEVLIRYLGFISWIFYFLTMVALFVIRSGKRVFVKSSTDFSVFILLPIVIVAVGVFIVAMSLKDSPIGSCVIGLIVVLLVGFHYLIQYRPLPPYFAKFDDKCCDFLCKTFDLVMSPMPVTNTAAEDSTTKNAETGVKVE